MASSEITKIEYSEEMQKELANRQGSKEEEKECWF
jgi:hypothetical protein